MERIEFNPQHFSEESAKFLYEKFLKDFNSETLNVALSGGSTPVPILKQLAKLDLPWPRINFFLVDERSVPSDSFESNYGTLKEALGPQANIYQLFYENKDSQAITDNYKRLMASHFVGAQHRPFPQFDLIILGMGLDGHIASLFPNTEALNEKTELVVRNEVPQLGTTRYTLTFPVINNSRNLILLIKGEEKNMQLDNFLSNPNLELPIHKILDANSELKIITTSDD